MKKKFTKILGVGLVLALLVSLLMMIAAPVSAAKPADGCVTIQDGTLVDTEGNPITVGYDQWGYNYQARVFNGFYENNARPDVPVAESDTWLQMKWNDAWLSNKSCDGNNLLDRHYGHDDYIGSGAWLTNHQSGSYLGDWDVTGDWILEFDYLGSLYIHDMTVVDNIFTGTGGYPSGGDPYSITWTVAGTIDGDDIAMTISYDGSSYYVDALGTIAQDGTMSGTWGNLSQTGVWESTLGVASNTYKWNYFVKIVAVPADAYVVDGLWFTAEGIEIGPVIWGAFAVVQRVYNDQGTGEHGIELLSPAGPGLGAYK